MSMDKDLARASLALVVSFLLTATGTLAQEPVTGAVVRHQGDAFAWTMVRHVAQTYHIPAHRLKVGHTASHVLPLTGKTLHLAKILDTTTGKVYGVAADETGSIVDADSLHHVERRAYAARYGKLSPRLFQRLERAGRDETVAVLLWLDDGGEVSALPRASLSREQGMPALPTQVLRSRHREHIRKKLNIANSGINLVTYLQSDIRGERRSGPGRSAG